MQDVVPQLPVTKPSVSKQQREHKALTLISGLLHPYSIYQGLLTSVRQCLLMSADSTLPVLNAHKSTYVPFSDRVCGFLWAAGPVVCSSESCAVAATAGLAMEWVQNASSAALSTYIYSNGLLIASRIVSLIVSPFCLYVCCITFTGRASGRWEWALLSFPDVWMFVCLSAPADGGAAA